MSEGVVLFDIDGTLTNGKTTMRPGAVGLLRELRERGFVVHLWSLAGKAHACAVAARLGMVPWHCHRKPPVPINPTLARAVIGTRPVLTVDNDVRHRVKGWPTLIVDSWWGAS